MPVIKIADTDPASAFPAALESALHEQGRVFVQLIGSPDPATNESWFVHPLDPWIKKAIATLPDAILLETHAGDKPTWKSATNYYRVHLLLQATSVPTIYEFGKDGKVIKKLVDPEITEESLAVFIQ
ncbi:Thioredoxin domain-containing protein 17 [Physocladia obscura]|uniref:Thioredoxin domain-containing protein 17 n=1 Tax=Physocladia obscura TaxID=109957 RepID=A0AAD5XK47_9FUNG|nr:Thioredoxin domain-containing protein 17 [Physocladia obscura]